MTYQDDSLRSLSRSLSTGPQNSKEIRRKLDQHDKIEKEYKKKQAQEMIKDAFAKKKKNQ